MKTKILYIEDNDQNFYLVSFILNAKGYAVARARDGKEGIDLTLNGKPDLILLDIQLPVMDGYETARELRKIPGVRTTPIVALTSYAMAGDREKAIEAGCTGYIEKPINPKTFTEQIENYLPAGALTGDRT
jgi:two-component system cell cycle response regulator DivK